MPRREYRDQKKACAFLKKIFSQVPLQGINRSLLVIEVLASYELSKKFVDHYIDLHIEGGVLREEEGVLYGV